MNEHTGTPACICVEDDFCTEPLTKDELDALSECHVSFFTQKRPVCLRCVTDYPCAPARLIAELRALRRLTKHDLQTNVAMMDYTISQLREQKAALVAALDGLNNFNGTGLFDFVKGWQRAMAVLASVKGEQG